MAAREELTGTPAAFAARLARLNGPDRVGGVDLARGLAVIGMFAAHLLVTAEQWVWTDPATWSAIVDGRSSILFATLAGVSIGLVTGGPRPLPGPALNRARGRLAARAGLLWMLGILLILTGVPVYVILPAYGILFLLALPFLRLGAGVLLALAAALALIMPLLQPMLADLPLWQAQYGAELSDLLGWHYPFPAWMAFLLAGLGVARAGVTARAVQLRMLIAGAALATLGYGLALVPPDPSSEYLQRVWQAEPHSTGLLEVIGSGGFAIAVIGGCLLLCRNRMLRMIVLPLRATGAMPLTAYTVQLVVWAAIAVAVAGDAGDLQAFRDLEPFWPLTVWTIAGCTVWALLIGRGPLEWLVDRAARLAVRSHRLDG
ncbi:heparan-alpha-glucosaminide N-acetyltransferase domain-containing protein [Microbacterium sp.]|uniref:heparan-alpha-glucosaminide N-acetyltransferase domain-containing protein n=1 Tax=Microbacterium sp. TaxID=51671 RepID=UPI0028123989|nr:heparan-alpha-glucosaminide N-acetyltransferase domain-containing protein [Microbacterium sp.]